MRYLVLLRKPKILISLPRVTDEKLFISHYSPLGAVLRVKIFSISGHLYKHTPDLFKKNRADIHLPQLGTSGPFPLEKLNGAKNSTFELGVSSIGKTAELEIYTHIHTYIYTHTHTLVIR